MRRMVGRFAGRARGIALLIVLVVLVLIATLATEIAITARTHHTLSQHAMDELLLRTTVDGRVEILKNALTYQSTQNLGYDGEDAVWAWHNKDRISSWGERGTSAFPDTSGEDAKGAASYKNTDVQLTAWCEDERAKINLRALTQPQDSPAYKNTYDSLVRLIDVYRDKWSSLDLSESDAKDMLSDLTSWMQAESDTDENPLSPTWPNHGRLQSVDDLLRVPGGHWTAERLYDVKDPDATDDNPNPATTTTSTSSASSTTSLGDEDTQWTRQNGVPGLARFLTVSAETSTGALPAMKININTASVTVLRALLDPADDELAAKIVDYRRQGATDSTTGSTTSTTGTTSGTNTQNPDGTSTTSNYFKAISDLSKVPDMEKDLSKYPRLNFFAITTSNVYSIRVLAKVVRGGSSSSGGGASSDDANAPKDVDAVLDYREVVQRGTAGFVTLFVERRNDPIFDTTQSQ